MISTFINSFKVSFAQKANTFIYFTKRIPLIGKKVPDDIYKKTHAKLFIGVLCEILKVLGGFLGKVIYLGVMIILPTYLMTRDIEKMQAIFLHIFFFLSFVIGPFIQTKMFEKNNKAAFDMITLMKADARKYFVSELLYKNITDFIYFVLPVTIIGLILGFSPLKAIVLVSELISLRLIGTWIQLFIYDKKESMLKRREPFLLILSVLGLVLAYALPFLGFDINFSLILFNVFVVITVLSLGLLAFIYILKFKKYILIAKDLLTKDNLFNGEAFKTDMTFGAVKLDEKKMNTKDLNTKKYNSKQGYEYLNSIFFLRFKRIMVRPIIQRVIFIFIVFLITMYFVLFMPDKNGDIVTGIKKGIPILVFVMYSMSTGERICKAMFFNCDVNLLRYSYYREAGVILSNFTSRLKRVVVLNLIPALTLCVTIVFIVLASGHGSQLIKMMPIFLCIICLACFFSIHHLFMYYVLQPYTAELTIKSPLFKIINMVVYIASYACLQIETSSYYFAAGVIVTTILYMIVALILTYRVAPKTFKLKN